MLFTRGHSFVIMSVIALDIASKVLKVLREFSLNILNFLSFFKISHLLITRFVVPVRLIDAINLFWDQLYSL